MKNFTEIEKTNLRNLIEVEIDRLSNLLNNRLRSLKFSTDQTARFRFVFLGIDMYQDLRQNSSYGTLVVILRQILDRGLRQAHNLSLSEVL